MAVAAIWQWFLEQPWYIQAAAVLFLATFLVAVIVWIVDWIRSKLS